MNKHEPTDDELELHVLQLWKKAGGGDSRALSDLLIVTQWLISERRRQADTRRRAGGQHGKEAIIIPAAIRELTECALDWEIMQDLLIQEASAKGVKSPNTVRSILDRNRRFIEDVARRRWEKDEPEG